MYQLYFNILYNYITLSMYRLFSRPSFSFYLFFLHFLHRDIFSLSLSLLTSPPLSSTFLFLQLFYIPLLAINLYFSSCNSLHRDTFSFFISIYLFLSFNNVLSSLLILPLYVVTSPFLWKRRQRPGQKRPKERSFLWHWARVSAGNTPACAGSIYSYSPAPSPKTSRRAWSCSRKQVFRLSACFHRRSLRYSKIRIIWRKKTVSMPPAKGTIRYEDTSMCR